MLHAHPPVWSNPEPEDLLIPTAIDIGLGYAVWASANPGTVATLGAVNGGGAALLHYRFVRIHPFDDGNGRLARLLMNFASCAGAGSSVERIAQGRPGSFF